MYHAAEITSREPRVGPGKGQRAVSIVNKGTSGLRRRWRDGWGPPRAVEEEEGVDFLPSAMGIH